MCYNRKHLFHTIYVGMWALLATIALHKWKHQTLLSVAGGTLCYVLLVQLVF